MKIYIAGKITGLVYEDALRMFVEAEVLLKELGHEPVNPMKENGLDGDGNPYAWAEYMKRDIPHLLQCDGILLLSNWEDSKGARLERLIAEELGMHVAYDNKPSTWPQSIVICKRCGMALSDDDEPYLCYRCRNGISSVSGVGIQSPARV